MKRRELLNFLALGGLTAIQPDLVRSEEGAACRSADLGTDRWLSPEMFGAKGDGISDDTEAFRRMLACGESRIFAPDPSRTYALSATLDLGAWSRWVEDLSIVVTASDLRQHEPLLYVEGEHVFRRIVLALLPGASWRALIRNDVYGGPKAVPRRFAAERIDIAAATQLAGYQGDTASAITLAHLEQVEVLGGIHTTKVDRPVFLNTCREVAIGPCRLLGFFRGIQVDMPDRMSLGGGRFVGNSPNAERAPGHNALVLRGGHNISVGDMIVEDTGEHGIRLTGGELPSEAMGTVRFGQVAVHRPGACGFKASSNIADEDGEQNVIEDLAIEDLYVEDAGRDLDGLTDSDYAEPNNHFGLFLDNVRGVSVQASLARRENRYNGLHAVKLRSVTQGMLRLQAEGPFSNLVEIQDLDRGADMEMLRIDLQGRQWGLGGDGAALKFSRFGENRSIRDVTITAQITDGVDGIDLSGMQARIAGSLVIDGHAERLSGRAYIPPATQDADKVLNRMLLR